MTTTADLLSPLAFRDWLEEQQSEREREDEARRRGELVAALADLVDAHGLDDVEWALGVVEGDLAEAAAQVAVDARGGS